MSKIQLFFFDIDKNICELPWGTKINTLDDIKSNGNLTFIINKEKLSLDFIQIIVTEENIISGDKIHVIKPQTSINNYADLICQIIRDYVSVHVFGDSHSIITHKVTICRENWLGFNTNYPITMYRFGQEGLDLNCAIQVLGNGHELYPVRENDWVMYSYGEIDARFSLFNFLNKEQFSNINLDSELVKLVQNYINQVKINESNFLCKSIIYFILPPVEITRSDIPFHGSINERLKLYNLLTKKLYNLCEIEGIPIVNLYNNLTNPDGTLKLNFTSNGNDIHLDNKFYYLIRNALMKIIISNN